MFDRKTTLATPRVLPTLTLTLALSLAAPATGLATDTEPHDHEHSLAPSSDGVEAPPSPPESGAESPSAPPAPRVQFVLVSMDATPSARAQSRDFFHRIQQRVSRIRGADGRPATFTLFINTGFLQLDPRDRIPRGEDPERWERYRGVLPRNRPPIPYPDDTEALEQRVANTRSLASLGVEIGSHTVRHANGGEWSRERWEREFADHQRILDLHGLPRPNGIRAPFLATSAGYFDTLGASGMRYDTSRVTEQRRWPRRIIDSEGNRTNVWQVAVPRVDLPDGNRSVFFDLTLKRREISNQQYFELAVAEFEARYEGSRAPLLLSGHGNYTAPTVRFMRRVCARPDVRCGTFSELVEYMDAHPELEGAR